MSYLNLYNAPWNPAATFDYPLSVGYGQPARKPPIYLQLPAAASRVFGAPPIRLTDADSTRVQFDGDSAYERKMTGVGGLGGLGAKPPGEVGTFIHDFHEAAKMNPAALYFGIGALVLVTLGAFKVLGRLGT